jgi:hypothetical protein
MMERKDFFAAGFKLDEGEWIKMRGGIGLR